jgi:hypothetical protein
MTTNSTNRSVNSGSRSGSLIVGAVLVALGILFLFGQFFRVDFGHYLWPFFVLAAGAGILAVAFGSPQTATRTDGAGLAALGSMVSMAGLILLFQNMTNLWATWAYAWALIAPTSVGLGQLAYGALKNQPHLVTAGTRATVTGFIIFLAGLFFFEFVIGISGFGFTLGSLGWPILLIGLGVLLLVATLFGRRG